MILYNVTITVDKDVHEDWLRWMHSTHIPDVMSTGMFLSYRISRLIGHEHEDAEIYSIQYLVQDMSTLVRYQSDYAPALQKDVRDRYNGKFEVFRTVMELIDHNESKGE